MFEVIFDKRAFKELSQLENEAQQLIWSKIAELRNGSLANDKALKGNHKGKFRKRAGDYRIVYLKEGTILLITIIRIAHRKEVY